MLRAYSTIRQPRAQMVWEGSRYAGSIYDFHGPHGTTAEGIREDLRTMYDRVWHHDMASDMQQVLASLQQSGVFPTQ